MPLRIVSSEAPTAKLSGILDFEEIGTTKKIALIRPPFGKPKNG